MTNAEYIRNMDDEAFADFLNRVHMDPCRTSCGNLARCLRNNMWEPVCKRHYQDWLKAEK